MDELRDISLFVEVAKLRNFSRASDRLAMPASTLSRRISALEASLGTRLFVRTTRRVDLTEAGQRYLTLCEQIVEAAGAAREELHQISRTPKGPLRVTMSPDIGTVYLASAIARFSQRYPAIYLQLDLSPRRMDILAEGFDLAIRIGQPVEPYLVARRLFTARRGLFAAPSFLASQGPVTSPPDLQGMACIRIDHPDSPVTWQLKRGTEQVEIEARGMLTANNPRMVLQLAAEGCGLAIGDRRMAEELVAAGRLVQVLPEWSVAPVVIYAVTASRDPTVKTRLFIEHLRAVLTRDADDQLA